MESPPQAGIPLSEMLEVLEEKTSQPRILNPAKLSFKKAERLPQTQKLREFKLQ